MAFGYTGSIAELIADQGTPIEYEILKVESYSSESSGGEKRQY